MSQPIRPLAARPPGLAYSRAGPVCGCRGWANCRLAGPVPPHLGHSCRVCALPGEPPIFVGPACVAAPGSRVPRPVWVGSVLAWLGRAFPRSAWTALVARPRRTTGPLLHAPVGRSLNARLGRSPQAGSACCLCRWADPVVAGPFSFEGVVNSVS